MKRHKYIIYLIENTVNGKRYFGITGKALSARWSNHLAEAKAGSSKLLHRAIRKYGKDAFSMRAIATYPRRDLLTEREPLFIAAYNMYFRNGHGYNMTKGGDGVGGLEHSANTRARLSSIKRTWCACAGNRQKLKDAAAKGNTQAGNAKRRARAHLRYSDPKFMAMFMQRAIVPRMRAVTQFDRQGNFIAEYPSARAASRATGIYYGNIGSCAKGGRHPTAGGFIWRFKECAACQ